MWKPFTENARKAIVLAQEEAARLGQNYLGTEHILLGILSVDDCRAAGILERQGISKDKVFSELEKITIGGKKTLQGDMSFTPRAKKVIEQAFEESKIMGGKTVGTEHLLLGLAREESGIAASILQTLRIDYNSIKLEIDLMSGAKRPPNIPPPKEPEIPMEQMRFPRDEYLSMEDDMESDDFGEEDYVEEEFEEKIALPDFTTREISPAQRVVGYVEKGYTIEKLGSVTRAEECYQAAMDLNPVNMILWDVKGDAFAKIGKHEKAVDCYEKVLQLEPNRTETWNKKGMALREMGKISDALKCFDRAIKSEEG